MESSRAANSSLGFETVDFTPPHLLHAVANYICKSIRRYKFVLIVASLWTMPKSERVCGGAWWWLTSAPDYMRPDGDDGADFVNVCDSPSTGAKEVFSEDSRASWQQIFRLLKFMKQCSFAHAV